MNCQRIVFLLLIILLSSSISRSQNIQGGKSFPSWSYGARVYYGSLLRFHQSQPLLGLTHIECIEIFASKQTYGNDSWSEYYKYPELEIAFSAYRFDMRKEFGNMFSIGPKLKYTLLKKKNSTLNLGMGMAANYATRLYDREDNTFNEAISARFNIEMRGNLNYRYRLSDKWSITGSFAYRHMSNGGIKKPNNGQNFIMLGVGTIYRPQNRFVELQKSNPKYYNTRIRLHLMYSRGWKHVHSWMNVINYVNTINFSASKRITMMNSIAFGLEGIYDSSTYLEDWWVYKRKDDETEFDNRRASAFGGVIFHLGNLSMYLNFHYFIYQPHFLFSNVYQKYGFTYHFIDHIFLHGGLLAHRGTADHLQFGIGLTL